jgi:hypothetical protein
MDSRSDKARDQRYWKRVLKTISSMLECLCGDGLQATCDIYVSDRDGKFLEGRRFQAHRDSAGALVVVYIETPSRPSPDAK